MLRSYNWIRIVCNPSRNFRFILKYGLFGGEIMCNYNNQPILLFLLELCN